MDRERAIVGRKIIYIGINRDGEESLRTRLQELLRQRPRTESRKTKTKRKKTRKKGKKSSRRKKRWTLP
jgi:16S rRNA G1207 methylase RsmC|tara:strand:- start:130 stop:336 length:207 start_codon:yes stop_codon:yes gene_type:complete